jgi:transposase-like protein
MSRAAAIEIDVPRARDGSLEPKIVARRQNRPLEYASRKPHDE